MSMSFKLKNSPTIYYVLSSLLDVRTLLQFFFTSKKRLKLFKKEKKCTIVISHIGLYC